METIKTLLIDNYDSFTCNLYHLIAAANGVPPVLIHNNQDGWRKEQFSQFDNIVLSPGPGRPDNPKDFGLCADAICQKNIPVLGICLGHQGICSIHGADIVQAKEICHGRLFPISHSGEGLFSGIPSPITVVRYHSLAATHLPDTLNVTATTADGTIMGIQHRTLPQWGIQFHPESICSDYGKQLLTNFRQMTEAWWRSHKKQIFQHKPPPSIAIRTSKKSQKTKDLYLLHREMALSLNNVQVERLFNRCFLQEGAAIWLDSNRAGYGSGRFSFLCAPSGLLGRIATADVTQRTVTVRKPSGEKTVFHKDCLDWLSEELQNHQVEPPKAAFEFSLGWLGYLGYELKAQCGAELAHPSPYPDAALLFCDRGIVIDHQENKLHLLTLTDSGTEKDANLWLDRIQQAIEKDTHLPEDTFPDTLHLTKPISLRHNMAEYINRIKACQSFIRQGETYEVCLTNTVTGATDADAWTVYRMLRRHNPAPYSAFMQLDDISIISCSPERFMKISRDGRAETKPIKGTRPREVDAARDAQIINELASNEKERAENLMIVDLARHDLGWTAEIGSVSVPKLFNIESYQTVHQMVSTVTSRIRQDISPCQCIKHAFPGGSMTGAPKKRTMEIIDHLEGAARGIYSGALGYFSLCGAVDLNIVIRTLIMRENGEFSFGIGGAITVLSDPVAEYEETRDKAKAFLDLFGTNFPA